VCVYACVKARTLCTRDCQRIPAAGVCVRVPMQGTCSGARIAAHKEPARGHAMPGGGCTCGCLSTESVCIGDAHTYGECAGVAVGPAGSARVSVYGPRTGPRVKAVLFSLPLSA